MRIGMVCGAEITLPKCHGKRGDGANKRSTSQYLTSNETTELCILTMNDIFSILFWLRVASDPDIDPSWPF